MKQNVGKIDKMARIILATLMSVLYFTGIISGTLGVVLLVLGGVFLITGFLNFCPLYTIFGANTCEKN